MQSPIVCKQRLFLEFFGKLWPLTNLLLYTTYKFCHKFVTQLCKQERHAYFPLFIVLLNGFTDIRYKVTKF